MRFLCCHLAAQVMHLLRLSDPRRTKREIAIMRKVSRHIRRSPKSARAYLIEHGFITSDGRLTKRYS